MKKSRQNGELIHSYKQLSPFATVSFQNKPTRCLQSWTKMLRKIHLLCFILEYFTPKNGLVKILPPPPQKTMLKGHSNISGRDVTTLIREGWREGPPRGYIHWVCPPCTTKCKILNTFCPRLLHLIYLIAVIS